MSSSHTLTHTLIRLVQAFRPTPRGDYKKAWRPLSDTQSHCEIPGGSKLDFAARTSKKQRKEKVGRTSRSVHGLDSQAIRSELHIIPFRQAPKPSTQQINPSGSCQLRFSKPARSGPRRSPEVHLLRFSGSEDGCRVRTETGTKKNHQDISK